MKLLGLILLLLLCDIYRRKNDEKNVPARKLHILLYNLRITCSEKHSEVLHMVETLEIDSDAELIERGTEKVPLDTNKVLVFIDHENKVVYLWRGKKASLFKKLMGTRVAARLSKKYRDYRIRPVSEDHEPATLKELIR